MGLGNELRPSQRAEIIGAKKNRVPLTQISANLGIPYSTVKYTWAKRNTRGPD